VSNDLTAIGDHHKLQRMAAPEGAHCLNEREDVVTFNGSPENNALQRVVIRAKPNVELAFAIGVRHGEAANAGVFLCFAGGGPSLKPGPRDRFATLASAIDEIAAFAPESRDNTVERRTLEVQRLT